ncbi:glutamate carboxypeptidase [Jiangella alba]|uniref:Glutamate carboxypeptidase n=1 Tax=Jiangella alba TaxID=561176 RepID=A0A1H5L7K8_9ACTN|nr:M20/M25/M40 family metallo-hydrolase [Jiangella alba]SEE72547.1 glutamate carboxypeptidase [Jiangella alba]
MVNDVHPRVAAAHDRLAEVVADSGRLIRCESPSADLAAVARSADRVAEVGAAIVGARPERIVSAGCVHLRWRWGDGPRRVLVLGHHDTVWPLGTIDAIPFEAGDRIRGPGCLDMKAGLALAFHAIAGLDDPSGVTLLVTGDEELGSPTSRELIEAEAEGCAAVLVLEAGADSGALKTERKGRAHYVLTFTGRAAHAGLEPHLGANALTALGSAVGRVAALADDTEGTSVTPTGAEAGTADNTVPELATLRIDVRARTVAELVRVDTATRGLVPADPGVALEVAGGIDRPPLEATMTAGLFRRASALAEGLGLAPLTGAAVGGGSDGNLTAAAGVPTLDGLGAVGGGAHARHEWVDTALLGDRLALLTALIEDVLAETGAGDLP